MARLLEFLQQLDERKTNYSIEHNRDEAVMVLVATPGKRWEVEFFQDGAVEVEIFTSDGKTHGDEVMQQLLDEAS